MDDTDSDENRLREIAHKIWEQEGKPEGQHERHWEMAKEALEAEKTQGSPSQSTPIESVPTAANDI